jgi:hypothetical protein
MVAAAILAVVGWIWALTDAGMPDALWLLTVLLSVIAIALAVYAIISDRTSAGRRR